MGSGTEGLAQRAQDRAAREPAFADVLEAILEAPTTDAGELTHLAAAEVNDARRSQALDEFRAGSLRTAEVQRLLRVSSAQAVHVMKDRRKLLGRTIGNATWFPAWQLSGGQLRDDLPALLAALGDFSDEPVAADRIMRLRRDELGGASLVEALEDPRRSSTAWNLIGALGLGH
jgi:hypothetical protein